MTDGQGQQAQVGIVLLVHTAFHRAEQVARHWSAAGCPLVIHADKSVPAKTYDAFMKALSDVPNLRFSRRYRCEWGTWGLVAATQSAAEVMLADFPEVRHVYLASGSCLPLRPVEELIEYLAQRPQTDFIESATTADVPWTIGGLDHERFTLRFPFSWRRHRYLFDKYVDLQRRLGVRRNIPNAIVPHMGSQWWCLTRQTLSAILQDPERPTYDRYFRRVWIPDESYFQTLARLYARRIESRSLTLSKFDYQGKPHIFYDDHLQLLRRVLALLGVVGELCQHRAEEARVLAGVDHGAVHLAEHLRELAERIGQGVALGHSRAHLQQQRLRPRLAALFRRRLQALGEGQVGQDQRGQLAGQ